MIYVVTMSRDQICDVINHLFTNEQIGDDSGDISIYQVAEFFGFDNCHSYRGENPSDFIYEMWTTDLDTAIRFKLVWPCM